MNTFCFDSKMMSEIRKKFHYLNEDPRIEGRRLFFDNGGGSLRLKETVSAFSKVDAFPDCPERGDFLAKDLFSIYEQGIQDIRTILNTHEGSIVTEISASQVSFKITETIIKHIPGTNVVVTEGDHPSSYDAAEVFAREYNKEFRVAKTNPETGGTDVEEIISLIDGNTTLLSFIYASNTSGAILDVQTIVKEARKIKPDLYVIVDAVQFAAHDVLDVNELQVDGINFAPYKFFSTRGIGVGYVSERLAKLPHDRFNAVDEKSWGVGSPTPGLFAAITEVVNYVSWIGEHYISNKSRRETFVEGMKRINLHERYLMNRMLEGTEQILGLRHIPGVTVYLDTEDLTKKVFLVGMSFDHLSVEESAKALEKVGIITYPRTNNSIFSKRTLDSFGIEGFVRITPLHCHTQNDIDDFLIEVLKIAEGA